jgi:hypothetical protein
MFYFLFLLVESAALSIIDLIYIFKNMSTLSSPTVVLGQTVFFRVAEEYWTKPYPKKRHHAPEFRSVILRGNVVEARGAAFKALLTDNNQFEKDGEAFVVHQNDMLVDQDYGNYGNLDILGKWIHN